MRAVEERDAEEAQAEEIDERYAVSLPEEPPED